VQSVSGSGALTVGLRFIARYLPRKIYISDPTWPIHRGIIENQQLTCLEYPYYCSKTKGFDFDGMTGFLKTITPGSVIILHACAHNPTGIDPTK
jgi:aspartate aminotransferase